MLGTLAAFLMDRMNNSITSPEIIDAVSGWPSLGIIPALPLTSKGQNKGDDLVLQSAGADLTAPLVVVSGRDPRWRSCFVPCAP